MQEAREIEDIDVREKMKGAYLDYSMSVIVGRALPDVRDGLKPVHRRILYAMWDMGLKHNQAYKKSARVVGDVLGKYHPHGDQAVYDSFVRMAQSFSLRYPLVDGKGNFGSLDGDSPAAMRYTAGRLTKVAEEMLKDMDKDTVDFRENFDGSMKEPVVLPSKVPNLLINGASGIAVGMATNIPPHNLKEVIDTLITYIEEDDPSVNELMNDLKGPDFPTGGEIIGRSGIKEAYETGKGKVKNRALVDVLREKNRIVVDKIPYNVKKSKIVEQIADLVKEDKLEGIRDLRDESDREGLRIVVDLKKKANPDVVLNKLFKKTSLEKTFGITNLAIVDGEPELLNLKEILREFVEHRVEVVKRRTQYLLKKAENRIHILNGLLTALENIDDVVELIQDSEDRDVAKEKLINRYDLSQDQAQAILKMRLQKLTGLEKQKLEKEHKNVSEDIKEYKRILSIRENILEVVKEESKEIKEKYGDERRTRIREAEKEIDEIDLIPKEQVVISITKNGYIKRTPLNEFKKQNRGGRGLISMEVRGKDNIMQTKIASTHDYLLFFTNKGNLYWLRSHRIPEYNRRSRGRPIVNYLELDEDEEIHSLTSLDSLNKENSLLFATKKGRIKRTAISHFSNPRSSGIIAINLEPDDELIEITELKPGEDILLLNNQGKLIRFSEKEVRKQGRATMGVKGMELEQNQEITAIATTKEKQEVLPITEKGYGKLTPINKFRKTHRAGKGVRAIKQTKKNGKPTDLITTQKETEIFLTTKKGYSLRTTTKNISKQGRNTMGVKLADLKQKDRLIDIEKINNQK